MHRTEGANNTIVDGKSQFTEGPPATTIPANWLNAMQEEIANVIEQTGGTLLQGTTDTKNQLWNAIRTTIQPYDYVVNSQATFQDAIERVGANQYKIKSDYKSIYFRNITGGYSMVSAAVSLSGGVDSWGYLETNACTLVEFENGATLGMGAQRGYIEANTADCLLRNAHVTGDGTAAAIVQSFLLNNVRVTFDNCKCSNRNSNVDMVGFQGSGTALHNITSKYINCTVFTLDGADKLHGFKSCHNLNNCIVYDLDGSGDNVNGFNDCDILSNCIVYDIETSVGTLSGFKDSSNLSNCKTTQLDAVSTVNGFENCNQLSSCYANDIDSSVAGARGFENCNQLSSCYANDIDSVGNAEGFRICWKISSCYANDIDSSANNGYGFGSCGAISSCRADNISASITAAGFFSCNYGAALWTGEAVNNGNDWMDTVDANIINKVSTPSVWT
jgi:hypothetical protein